MLSDARSPPPPPPLADPEGGVGAAGPDPVPPPPRAPVTARVMRDSRDGGEASGIEEGDGPPLVLPPLRAPPAPSSDPPRVSEFTSLSRVAAASCLSARLSSSRSSSGGCVVPGGGARAVIIEDLSLARSFPCLVLFTAPVELGAECFIAALLLTAAGREPCIST